jgi:hypothetical protein
MAEGASAHPPHPAHVASPISIGWVVLAALMIGIGLGIVAYWQITQNWLYFLGLVPTVLGGLMLMSPRAGLDHA